VENSPTFHQIHKVVFGWSWGKGLIPPALIVISSVARDLLRFCFRVEFEEGQSASSIYRHVERSETSPPFLFSGGVRGGSVHLLDIRRRPLVKTARDDTPIESFRAKREISSFYSFRGSLEGVMSNPLN